VAVRGGSGGGIYKKKAKPEVSGARGGVSDLSFIKRQKAANLPPAPTVRGAARTGPRDAETVRDYVLGKDLSRAVSRGYSRLSPGSPLAKPLKRALDTPGDINPEMIALDAAMLLPFGKPGKILKRSGSKRWNNKRLQEIADREAEEAAAKVAEAAPKTPEEKMLESLKGTPKLKRQEKALQRPERARRAEALDKALLSAPGEEGWKRALGPLAGELPKIRFGALKQHDITNADVARWGEHIKTRDDFLPYEKLNVKRALDNVVAERVPTLADKKLLTRLWGAEKTAEVAQQATNWKRVTESGVNLINVPRAIKSSFDLSAPFRQGLVLGASHPIVFAKNFPVMIKAARSERFYNDEIEKIITSDTFDLAQLDGLAMTDLENIATREEAFIGANYAERFNPGIPNSKFQIPIGKGVRASGRAYTLFLNKFRKDVYDMLLEQAGHNDRVAGKAIANIINVATGRGNLGHFEEAIKIANAAFFSPRLIASRVELLMNPKLYVGTDASKRIARKEARRAMRNLIITGSALLYLADKVPGVDVGTDPRSADFGRIRVGDTRVDIWGGLQPYVVAAYRIKSGEKVSSTTNEVSKVGGGPFGQYDNFLGRFTATVGDLLQQKAAPVPGYLNAWRKEETFEGTKFDPKMEGAKLFLPIGFESAYDTQQKYGVPRAAVGFGLNAFGIGVNTYGGQQPKKKGSGGGSSGGGIYGRGSRSRGGGGIYGR
jgi:hypothetical protein